MSRREFIKLLGGAALWPMVARAQQPNRMPRIGLLMNLPANDPEATSRLAAFLQGLQELGWTDGRTVRVDYRWGGGEPDRYRTYAAELVGLAPDVILANGAEVVRALQRVTRTVPIVFAQATDPVGAGLVESLARPGGNTTGFAGSEYGVASKWLELIKQVAPTIKRAAIVRDSEGAAGSAQLAAIQSVAPSLDIELTPIGMHNADEIERGIAAFARVSNGSLIVTNGTLAILHRELITALAARHRLPAIYPFQYYVSGGGLMSYGTDRVEQYRGAARYVDRILRGERPADLPVQAPTKYELAINLKAAKALGLSVPPAVLARADEVIE